MKLLSKIKKALWGVGIFFITLRTKVYAVVPINAIQNEISGATMYGVEQAPADKIADVIESLTKFLGIIFIPVILILGIIAYVKKGKNSKDTKIFRLILIIAVLSLILSVLGLGIYRMIY